MEQESEDAVAAVQNYPFEAPIVRFESPCFHPNVDTAGATACRKYTRLRYGFEMVSLGVLFCICECTGPDLQRGPSETSHREFLIVESACVQVTYALTF